MLLRALAISAAAAGVAALHPDASAGAQEPTAGGARAARRRLGRAPCAAAAPLARECGVPANETPPGLAAVTLLAARAQRGARWTARAAQGLSPGV